MKHLTLNIILLTLMLLPVGNSRAGRQFTSTETALSEAAPAALQDSLSALIPSTFSPNRDGINDAWIIPGITEDGQNEVWIYNRWGILVFHQAPYDNKWTGRSSESGMGSKDLPEGTYYYILRWQGLLHKGSVYLKK